MKIIHVMMAGEKEVEISSLSKERRIELSKRWNEEAMKRGNYIRKHS